MERGVKYASSPDRPTANGFDAAHSFFHAHKELFEYYRFVGGATPFDLPSASFLDRYRECDGAGPVVVVSPVFTTSHLAAPALHFVPSGPTEPAFVSISSAAVLHAPTSTVVSPSPIHLSYPRSSQPERYADPPSPISYPRLAQEWTGSPPKSLSSPQNRPAYSPQKQIVATISDATPKPPLQSPQRQSIVPPSTRNFRMPPMNELLLDSSARRQLGGSQRRVDEASKIELLMGSKCVGRVSAATRNLPPAIRKRLDASANLPARKERLYSILLHDYQQLNRLLT